MSTHMCCYQKLKPQCGKLCKNKLEGSLISITNKPDAKEILNDVYGLHYRQFQRRKF
jgi:hypothetical protein